MKRNDMLQRATARTEPWDIIIIGGGATGVGTAVDAATRGYSTLLVEQSDFGKGTSSRATKLAHGGVRYLEQGNVSLVMEALKERGLMRQNAPHIVHELPHVVPSYSWWEGPFYGIGLKLYQALSGKYGFGPSQLLSKEETIKRIPGVNQDGLIGGVVYHDGQFDDTRLLINLVATAAEQGATLLNYARVTKLHKGSDGLINGLSWQDVESGETHDAMAKVIVNATGAFTDSVRQLGDPAAAKMIAPSQGAHFILDRSFLPGTNAILVPHTKDGRVMFAIPWHDHTLVGTTDMPLSEPVLEPVPMDKEIEFMLETASLYLAKKPTKADILSCWAGVRPLVKMGDGKNTAALSRDHTVHIDQCGLLSIAGGKWTTYRNMAQDAVNQAATLGDLPDKGCVTTNLNIHGYTPNAEQFGSLSFYGTDAAEIRKLIDADPTLGEKLDPELPYVAAEIVWAAREEMARTLEDVLARRTRALFLNSKAALRMAPKAVALLAQELGYDKGWQLEQIEKFNAVAQGFVVKM
jgi:glycerol-3-phosphate dehydrogenase